MVGVEADQPKNEPRDVPLDLLYPFYLDVDMSMAFAAVLTGGVSLEQEHIERITGASQAVKNLHGNLRVWRVGGIGADREQRESSDAMNEAHLVRRHTVASIFIDLYNELRRTDQILEQPGFDDLKEGDFISVTMGPAIAPLLRVVDQIIRLLDLMLPMLETDDGVPSPRAAAKGGSHHRSAGRAAVKETASPDQQEGLRSLRQLRRLFIAVRDDLNHSGMIDIVVARENEPSVVLTLDKRFVGPPALELLHTSKFTVVGKVTQIWREDDDVVPLYRRSVLSLLPALGGATAWNILMLLGAIAKSIDMDAIAQSAQAALGVAPDPPKSAGAGGSNDRPPPPPGMAIADQAEEVGVDQGPSAGGEGTQDIRFGDDVAALNPAVVGRAVQILPLAICS